MIKGSSCGGFFVRTWIDAGFRAGLLAIMSLGVNAVHASTSIYLPGPPGPPPPHLMLGQQAGHAEADRPDNNQRGSAPRHRPMKGGGPGYNNLFAMADDDALGEFEIYDEAIISVGNENLWDAPVAPAPTRVASLPR